MRRERPAGTHAFCRSARVAQRRSVRQESGHPSGELSKSITVEVNVERPTAPGHPRRLLLAGGLRVSLRTMGRELRRSPSRCRGDSLGHSQRQGARRRRWSPRHVVVGGRSVKHGVARTRGSVRTCACPRSCGRCAPDDANCILLVAAILGEHSARASGRTALRRAAHGVCTQRWCDVRLPLLRPRRMHRRRLARAPQPDEVNHAIDRTLEPQQAAHVHGSLVDACDGRPARALGQIRSEDLARLCRAIASASGLLN